MSKLSSFFFLFILLSLWYPAYSQDFPMRHYTVEDGLPSNTVYTTYRDKKGYIWISTDKGIARYNGIRFEVFTTYDGLPDNEVFFFQEDMDGRLWLGTYNGEFCYYKDGIFHSEKNTPFLRTKYKRFHIVNSFRESDSSITFKCSTDMLFNIKDDHITYIDTRKRMPKWPPGIISIKKLSADRYQLYYRDSVYVVDTLNNVLHAEKMPGHRDICLNLRAQDQYYNLFHDSVFTNDMQPLMVFKRDPIIKSHVYQLYINEAGYFLMTNDGILFNDSINMLKGNSISGITQDGDNNYWASTLTNGVFCIDKDFANTKMYTNAYKGKVLFAYGNKGHVFFANSENVLNEMENDTITSLVNLNKYLPQYGTFNEKHGHFIYNGFSYFGWSMRGFLTIDNLLARPLQIKKFGNNLGPLESIKSVVHVGPRLFLNTRRRVLSIDDNEFAKTEVTCKPVDGNEQYMRIFDMANGPGNVTWYSTVGKMYKAEQGKKPEEVGLNIPVFKNFDFFSDVLVGCTLNNQLYVCDIINGKVNIHPIASQNCIWDEFYKLDTYHVLISTNNLYRILTIDGEGNEKKYTVTTVENPFIPLNAEAICMDSTDCYFFKDGNITVINTKNLFEQPLPPHLLFTNARTGARLYNIANSLSLSYSESKNIRVSFSVISFSNQQIFTQYSFSKKNADEWHDIKGEEINLVNPGYGEYVLKIRARTVTSNFSSPILCTLDIAKPFWATWWFIILVTGSIITLAGIIIRYRVLLAFRNREERHRNEIKFLKSEYKALNALMNPHFIFNTLNNVQSLINKDDKPAANKYLRIFANLVRQNMHNISLELIPLHSEMNIVENYLKLEKLRFKELLNYSITIDDNVDAEDIMVPPLLVQPLVENSIKHGILPNKSEESLVNVHVSIQDNTLIIAVKDNGIGIDAALKRSESQHTSFGLENIRKRIAQLAKIQNKQMWLETNEIKDDTGHLLWTVVSIHISLQ